MAILSDYHIHSHFSGDSEAQMSDIIETAIARGMKSICFTEHMDMNFTYVKPEEEGMFDLSTDEYLYDLLRTKAKYNDQIEVYFGVEIGIQADLPRQLAAYVRSHEFDFVIGSVHLVNKMDPYYPAYFEGKTDEEAYREFFEEVYKNIKAYSNFDVLGHLDYIVRYGQSKDKDYCYDKYKDIIDKILTLILEKERGIEINTAGLSKGLKSTNPCKEIIKRYHELGGEVITVGSDAHIAENVAKDFDVAAEILKECGFTHYTVFENRIPIFKKI